MMRGKRKRSEGTSSSARRETNLRAVIYALMIAGAGLALLWAVVFFEWFDKHGITAELVQQLGGLFITTGGLAVLWELLGRRDLIREVLARVRLKAELEATGVTSASMDWRVVPWARLITEAKAIDMYIAYGSTWLSTNSAELAEFAKTRRNKMRCVFPDPDDPSGIKVLADRFDYTPEVLRQKIVSGAHLLAQIARDGKADIRVLYVRGAPTFTCYRFDETFVTTLYSNRPGRRPVPVLIARKPGTISDFFHEELQRVIEAGRELSPNDLLEA